MVIGIHVPASGRVVMLGIGRRRGNGHSRRLRDPATFRAGSRNRSS